MADVLCLRPLADFTKVGVTPPESLSVRVMTPDDAGLAGAVQAADGLVIPAVGPKLGLDLFDGARLRIVQVTGAGVDRLDVAGLKARGIPVANVPGGSNEALAEYATSCAAVLRRRLTEGTFEIRAGRYAEFRKRLLADNTDELAGLTVGVVGLGVIGSAVASRFRALGARIVYFDPAPRDAALVAALEAERLELDALLAAADVVTLHVPLIAETEGLLDARRLGLMKKDAVLIQAARGGIVSEAALAAALEAGALGGAAVDVYSTEPPGPDNPLLGLSDAAASKVILTPHVAGVTRQSWASLFQSAWDNVARVLVAGDSPRHVL